MDVAPQNGFSADGLIVDDLDHGLFQVNCRSYVDQDILEAERRLIFERTWLYVGHESEVPQKGSFIRRNVVGTPMIMVRDDDGKIRVLFNACTHRGNWVCQTPAGRTKSFRCFYHGFTFNTRGELISVPDPDGYSDKIDMKMFNLKQAPRVDSYRGLVFMSLNEDVESLRSFLGDVTEFIDVGLDMSVSPSVVGRGQQSYGLKANWKLMMDNSADVYHGLVMHKRYFVDYIGGIGGDVDRHAEMTDVKGQNKVIPFKNGHSVIEFPLGGMPLSTEGGQLFDNLRKELEAQHGKERAKYLLGFGRNILIFPNLSFITHWRSLRTFYSPTPDTMDVSVWPLVGEQDTPAFRELRYSNFVSFLGPGGFGTPDDVEALENCQRNFNKGRMEWADISRGMRRPGGPFTNDELQMRAFWRQWYACLNPTYKPNVEIPRHARVHAMSGEA